jgi:hypothetical protein
MDARYVEVLRLWVAQKHGPVLLLSLENVPEDVQRDMIVVTQKNVMDVAELVARQAAQYFYDPRKYLDPAFRDKMLCL